MADRTIFIISGPSGAGKGTICERIMKEMQGLALSVSFTTRAPRPRKDGSMEVCGEDYNFISHEEFAKRIADNDLYEKATVHGEWYGTSRSFVKSKLEEGNDVILEIDMQGALQVKNLEPNAVLIYILPPTKEEQLARLKGRGSETEEKLQKRLADAPQQLSYAYIYDYVVMNDDLTTAVEQVKTIIEASRLKACVNKPLIDKVKESY